MQQKKALNHTDHAGSLSAWMYNRWARRTIECGEPSFDSKSTLLTRRKGEFSRIRPCSHLGHAEHWSDIFTESIDVLQTTRCTTNCREPFFAPKSTLLTGKTEMSQNKTLSSSGPFRKQEICQLYFPECIDVPQMDLKQH